MTLYECFVVCVGLEVCQAFPCRCDETDSEQCSAAERKVGSNNVLHYHYLHSLPLFRSRVGSTGISHPRGWFPLPRISKAIVLKQWNIIFDLSLLAWRTSLIIIIIIASVQCDCCMHIMWSLLTTDSEVDAGQGFPGGWMVPQPPSLRAKALSKWHPLPEEIPGCSAVCGNHCQ
jgi:hypothetical protein